MTSAPSAGRVGASSCPCVRRTPTGTALRTLLTAAATVFATSISTVVVGLLATARAGNPRRGRGPSRHPTPAGQPRGDPRQRGQPAVRQPGDPPAGTAPDLPHHHGRQRDLRRGRRQLRSPARTRTATGATVPTTRRCSGSPSPRTSSTTSPAPAASPTPGRRQRLPPVERAEPGRLPGHQGAQHAGQADLGGRRRERAEGTISSAPVVTDCAINRVFFLGPCYGTSPTCGRPGSTGAGRGRGGAERHPADDDPRRLPPSRTTNWCSSRTRARSGPDVEDNPNFPGWYAGGCPLYLHDLAFARNKAVPMFETALRRPRPTPAPATWTAAGCSTVTTSAMTSPWARGLFIEVGIWNENAARQSYHPNIRGHGAFADCMTQFYNSGLPQASCVDPANTGVADAVHRPAGLQAAEERGHRHLRGRQGLQLAQPARCSRRTPVTAAGTRASGTTRRTSRCTSSCRTTAAWTSRRARSRPARPSRSTTATTGPTRSGCSTATRSSRPVNTGLCLAFTTRPRARRDSGSRPAAPAPGSSGRSSRGTSRTRSATATTTSSVPASTDPLAG